MQFPSMSSLQGALPSVTPSATVHPSNMGNQSFAWNPPSSLSYAPMLPPQAQTLASTMGPSIPFYHFLNKLFSCLCLFALYLYISNRVNSQGHTWSNKCQLTCQCQGNYFSVLITFTVTCFRLD
jgi:hypothetical protein